MGLLALIIIYVFPLFYMLTTAVKSFTEASMFPPKLLPKEWHFENFSEVFHSMNFLHYFKNSIIVTLLTIVGQIFVCLPAAYAFAKKQFRFKRGLYLLTLFDLIVPGQVSFLPIYIILSKWGWLNTFRALSVPFMYSAFAIFFLTQAFRTIPNDLLDAARMDKSSQLQIIFKILLPSAKSVVITVALFTFVNKWNDYFWATVLTTNDTVRTLPLSVQNLMGIGDGVTQWNMVMAGNVLLFAPMFLIYIFANKYIKQAFVYGGVK